MEGRIEVDLCEGLLTALECPICFEFMQPPILQCTSGHSMCSACIARVHVCPVCKVSLKERVRNYTSERLSDQFTDPCPNQAAGCPERTYGPRAALHERTCPYRVYDCPMARDLGIACPWRGLLKEILAHAKARHASNTFDIGLENKETYFSSYFGHEFYHWVSFFYWKDNLFVTHDHYDNEEAKCSKLVQYLGPSETASEFEYVIEFYSRERSRRQTYTRSVHSEEEDIDDLIENEDCFTISEKQAKFYLRPDQKLKFKWVVQKVQ